MTASFTIDSATGQLKTLAALDYETKASYSVTVTARDPGDLRPTPSTSPSPSPTWTRWNGTSGPDVARTYMEKGMDAELTATLTGGYGMVGHGRFDAGWVKSMDMTSWIGNESGIAHVQRRPRATRRRSTQTDDGYLPDGDGDVTDGQ